MKIFIAFACLFALATAEYTTRTKEDLDRARRVCIKKIEINPDRVGEYRQRVFRETDPETPKYIRCVFEELKLIRDGVFVTDDYLVQLGRGEGYRDRVVDCYSRFEDLDVRAFRTFMCFIEKGLLPEGY